MPCCRAQAAGNAARTVVPDLLAVVTVRAPSTACTHRCMRSMPPPAGAAVLRLAGTFRFDRGETGAVTGGGASRPPARSGSPGGR